MKDENVDEYITVFAELARKALYHEDDPAVLEKFKSGLPLELLEPCMNHDNPRNWEAWVRSTHACQAILTSLKIHQVDTTRQSPSPMKMYTSTPPSIPPPIPMEIDKMYTIPTRRSASPKTQRATKRSLSPLQKSRTHTTLLSKKSPRTACPYGKCTDRSSSLGPRSKMTSIPCN